MTISFIQSSVLIFMQLASFGVVIFGIYLLILCAKALKIDIRNNESK